MYALNLDTDNRILSTTFGKYAPPEQPRVDTLPDGDVYEYKYIDGEYVHDPLPEPEPIEPEPTADELLNAISRGLGYE